MVWSEKVHGVDKQGEWFGVKKFMVVIYRVYRLSIFTLDENQTLSVTFLARHSI